MATGSAVMRQGFRLPGGAGQSPRSAVRRMRLPFERVRPETVISHGAAPAADLHKTPDDEGKTAEDAKPKPQRRPLRGHADGVGGGPEEEPADKDKYEWTEIEQHEPPARAIAVMQPLDAHRNGGDENREIDGKAQDSKRRAVPQRPAAHFEHDVGHQKDKQGKPIFGAVDAAAKTEQQRPPIHSPLPRLRKAKSAGRRSRFNRAAAGFAAPADPARSGSGRSCPCASRARPGAPARTP